MTPGSLDFGTVTVATSGDMTLTLRNSGGGTLSGTATAPAPFSVVSGGTYSLGSNQSQTVTIRFSPPVAQTYNQVVTFTGGGGATVSLRGTGAAPMPPGTITLPAPSGVITGPFVVNNGAISQPSETTVTAGGRAAYTFIITNAGSYVIQALVEASGTGDNSFFVNIDAEPQDPSMIWDVLPFTTGFEQRFVSWRGSGTTDANEFVPKVFQLGVGTHTLIVRGREANAQLQNLSVLKKPDPPQGLLIEPSP